MPIYVSHQPSVQLLAQAGYAAGAGQFKQQQMEMAQRERMQMRALEFENIRQQRQTQQSMYRAKMAMMGQREANRAQLDLKEREAEWAQAEKELEHKNARDLKLVDQMDKMKIENLKSRNAQESDVVSQLNSAVIGRLEAIEDRRVRGFRFGKEYDYTRFQREMAEINKKSDMTPLAKANLILEKAIQLGLPDVPTTDLADQVSMKTVNGSTVAVSPDGVKVTKVDPPKSSENDIPLATQIVMDPAKYAGVVEIARKMATTKDPVTEVEKIDKSKFNDTLYLLLNPEKFLKKIEEENEEEKNKGGSDSNVIGGKTGATTPGTPGHYDANAGAENKVTRFLYTPEDGSVTRKK